MLNRVIAEHPLFKKRFKNAQKVTSEKGYGLPLASSARNLSDDGIMLVGDAGSLIDPFTGEGIGNAMISGKIAAETAADSLKTGDLSAAFMSKYDQRVNAALGHEFRISNKLQQLVQYPFLFNMIVGKANRNPRLRELLSCMFDDLEARKNLKKPSFYLKVLLNP